MIACAHSHGRAGGYDDVQTKPNEAQARPRHGMVGVKSSKATILTDQHGRCPPHPALRAASALGSSESQSNPCISARQRRVSIQPTTPERWSCHSAAGQGQARPVGPPSGSGDARHTPPPPTGWGPGAGEALGGRRGSRSVGDAAAFPAVPPWQGQPQGAAGVGGPAAQGEQRVRVDASLCVWTHRCA
jgi:hypothetical protein